MKNTKKKFKKRFKKQTKIITNAIEELIGLTYLKEVDVESDSYIDKDDIIHSVFTIDLTVGKIKLGK